MGNASPHAAAPRRRVLLPRRLTEPPVPPSQIDERLSTNRVVISDSQFSQDVVGCIMNHIDRRSNPFQTIPWTAAGEQRLPVGISLQQVAPGVVKVTGASGPDRWSYFPNRNIIESNLVFLIFNIGYYFKQYFTQFESSFPPQAFKQKASVLRSLFINQINLEHTSRPLHERFVTILYGFCVVIVYLSYKVQMQTNEDSDVVQPSKSEKQAMAESEVLQFVYQIRRFANDVRGKLKLDFTEWHGVLLQEINVFIPRQLYPGHIY